MWSWAHFLNVAWRFRFDPRSVENSSHGGANQWMACKLTRSQTCEFATTKKEARILRKFASKFAEHARRSENYDRLQTRHRSRATKRFSKLSGESPIHFFGFLRAVCEVLRSVRRWPSTKRARSMVFVKVCPATGELLSTTQLQMACVVEMCVVQHAFASVANGKKCMFQHHSDDLLGANGGTLIRHDEKRNLASSQLVSEADAQGERLPRAD
jgi:hypothetical protein